MELLATHAAGVRPPTGQAAGVQQTGDKAGGPKQAQRDLQLALDERPRLMRLGRRLPPAATDWRQFLPPDGPGGRPIH